MTDLYLALIILALIILALITILMWEKWQNNRERARFTNALIAKTPEQFRDLELTDKVKPITPPVQEKQDLVAESDLTDEEFLKHMNGGN